MGAEKFGRLAARFLKDRVHFGQREGNRVKDANFKIELPVTIYDRRSKYQLSIEGTSTEILTDKCQPNMTFSTHSYRKGKLTVEQNQWEVTLPEHWLE